MEYSKPLLKARPPFPELFIPGAVYLFQACDILGKQMFPAEWDGREVLARRSPEIGDQPPGPYSRHGKEVTEQWYVDLPSGTRVFTAQDEAKAASDMVKADVLTLANAERAARIRFLAVVRVIRAWLAEKPGRGFGVDRENGRERKVPIEFWRSNQAAAVFEMGEIASRWANPNFVRAIDVSSYWPSDITGNAFVRRAELPSLEPAIPGAVDRDWPLNEGEAALTRTGAPGRPAMLASVLIADEHKRRVASGEVADSLRNEASALLSWLEKEYPKTRKMTKKSIENLVRKDFRDAKVSGKEKP